MTNHTAGATGITPSLRAAARDVAAISGKIQCFVRWHGVLRLLDEADVLEDMDRLERFFPPDMPTSFDTFKAYVTAYPEAARFHAWLGRRTTPFVVFAVEGNWPTLPGGFAWATLTAGHAPGEPLQHWVSVGDNDDGDWRLHVQDEATGLQALANLRALAPLNLWHLPELGFEV
jgi:hypothetical protein